jgi:co-chaperonin GroES (HSP10)
MNYHERDVTASGIVLAQPTDMFDADEHSRGLVVAIGDKRGLVEIEAAKGVLRASEDFSEALKRLDRLTPAPFDVTVGDVVLFPPTAGISLGEQEDGITYVVLHETDIHAILEPKAKVA